MILLDTNVVSEPLKPRPSAAVLGWLNAQDPWDLHISTITVAELFAGVEVLPKGNRRSGLQRLIERELLPLFEGRILPFDESAAREFGKIVGLGKAKGRPVKFDDGAIAAIAKANRMTVSTRNIKHFETTGVHVVDPWLWTS
ncbi:type II toxin-antitoxin system VapC family toxin [Roseateles sp. UC29_93]|uniref:type II toxin-antitoxin system VapC family toxin n=1 Tax=Roseateles TaxID=93681 RepID=UPI000316AC94